jgi:WhiB family redox-sensing transcriptional regulator
MTRPKNTGAGAGIPFPTPATPTACRTQPRLFDHGARGTSPDDARRVAQALCTACPVAADCLKWALAHPDLSPEGIWAGTTAAQRRKLRRRLIDRLGTQWAAVVAEQDRQRKERQALARHQPLTIRQAQIVREDRERNGPMGRPRPALTPDRQERNRERLVAAITGRAA